MTLPHEQARQFLLKAHDDLIALKTLLENREVSDEIIGFHAQQIIEKSLKAVLADKAVVFRRTHDLAELIDLCNDNKIHVPTELEKAVELTPFAVEFRYDFLPAEEKETDHIKPDEIRTIVQQAITWATHQLDLGS
jgi:HEPN domain-containing protein